MSNVSCWWRDRQGARRTKIRLSFQRSYDPPAQVPSIYRICARLGSYYVSVPLKSLPRSEPFVWGIVAMMPSSCGNNLVIESVHPSRESLLRCQVSPRETRVLRKGSRVREYIRLRPISCTIAWLTSRIIMVEKFNYQLEELMKANLAIIIFN